MAKPEITVPLPKTDFSGGSIMVTSPFGPRNGGVHRGTDLGSSDGIEWGVAVFPGARGVVENRGDAGPGTGLFLWVRTNLWRRNDAGVMCEVGYKYFHLNRYLVAIGQEVDVDTVIAEVGGTGGYAAHLHRQCHLLDGAWDQWTDRTAVSDTDEIRELIANGVWPTSDIVELPPVIEPPADIPFPKPSEDIMQGQPIFTFGEDGHELSGLSYWVTPEGEVRYVDGLGEFDYLTHPYEGWPAICRPTIWLDRAAFIARIGTFVGPERAEEIQGYIESKDKA